MSIRELCAEDLEKQEGITEEFVSSKIKNMQESGRPFSEEEIRTRYVIGEKLTFVAVKDDIIEIISLVEHEFEEFEENHEFDHLSGTLPIFKPKEHKDNN